MPEVRECPVCSKEYEINWRNRDRKTCGRSCGQRLRGPRPEETRQKISRSNAIRKASQRGVFPSEKRCSKCKKRRPLAEFSWRRRKLRFETVLEPQPRCKICERKRMAEYRSRRSAEERRQHDRQWRASYQKRLAAQRKMRLELLPEFIEWYYGFKEMKRLEFTRHTRGETSGDTLRRGAGAMTNILRGHIDAERWANYIGLESASVLDNFERKLRRNDNTIPLGLLDTILHATGHEHLLAQWWDMA